MRVLSAMQRKTFARLREILPEKQALAVEVHLLVSGLAVGVFSWSLVSFLKRIKFQNISLDIRPWALPFFQPQDAALANYLALCLFTAGYALIIYTKGVDTSSPKNFPASHLSRLTRLTILSTGLLICALFLPLSGRIVALTVAFATSAIYSLKLPTLGILSTPPTLSYRSVSAAPAVPALSTYSTNSLRLISTGRMLISLGPWILLAIASLEPLLIADGHPYLINEYANLYSSTIIDGRSVNNLAFLSQIAESPVLNSGSGGKKGAELGSFDAERLRKFRLYNDLEYSIQNMGRGQFEHIGHILNPLNKYELNASLDQLYFHYGLGNTFVMKWLMDLFGGISVQNYYKCYLLYIAYGACFLGMLYYIFQGHSALVLGAFAIYVSAYFFTGFIGYIFAPGVIPSIHFFDVAAIACFAGIVRNRRNWIFIAGLVTACVLGVIMNPRFGWILTVSCVIGLVFYAVENTTRNEKLLWIIGAGCLVLGAVAMGTLLPGKGADDTVRYFSMGYLSWSPRRAVVWLTGTYLVVSYTLLIAMKNARHSTKYIYSMVFFYAQGMLTYYYWSGLDNHLPMAVPYIGLQVFLSLWALTDIFEKDEKRRRRVEMVKRFAVALALALVALGGYKFYSQKSRLLQHFATHTTFTWTLPKAKVVTTIDPAPIQEAVVLIQKYSDQQRRGIYIISKYDSCLPFLSGRYSLMPYLDLGYSLVSEKEVRRAVNTITEGKPEYIFVDSDIDTYSSGADPSVVDPWSKLFSNKNSNRERASRIGRIVELRRVYDSVASDYVKIDGGRLISVYRKVAA